MTGRVVLNTRPRDQAGELTRLLIHAGFDVVEAPAIATVSAWNPAEFDHVREDLTQGRYKWLVLQSVNAARGLEPEVRCASLVCGAATASALEIQPSLALERFSARAALDALTPHVQPGDRVLVPRAEESRAELTTGLKHLGVTVDAPVAYRTIAADEAARRLRLGGIDVLTLCSPSAARSVAASVSRETLVVCLGESTAEAARGLGLRIDGVAASTSMKDLVVAVEAALGACV